VQPRLTLRRRSGLGWYEDPHLLGEHGILVAFTIRSGGSSVGPYESLNLAGHVGDDPFAVDSNRADLFDALGIGPLRDRLVTAEQVHGEHMTWVGETEAGRGASVSGARGAIPNTDALVTDKARLPLMLLYADCVPVILVDAAARRVAVVHAGWRGALGGLPGKVVQGLKAHGSSAVQITAYVGAHICAKHYQVGNELLTTFVDRFGTFCEAEAGFLDLGAVVSADLMSQGVRVENICRLGICTAEATDRFFSYRCSGVTGRHAALAAIVG
jgi:YfiH family protein